MSDELGIGQHVAEVGGSALGGAGILFAFVRFIFGDLKGEITKLGVGVAALAEKVNSQHAEFTAVRAELAALKAMVERELTRHDQLTERVAIVERSVDALHRRFDELKPRGRR